MKNLITAFCSTVLLGGMSSALAAPLPNNSTLTIDAGTPSATNNPCAIGSCFAFEVAPGFLLWTDILPGTDGGIIVGKPQLPGSQLEGLSASATDPGELTAAWDFFGNYGTFTTAAVSGSVAGNITYDASANVFSDTSCASASCLGATTLGAFTLAWNGIATPLGNAEGCLSPGCSADQLAGINTDSYTIALDETGTGPYELMYSQVGPSGDPSGAFGDVRFSLILRGTATKANDTAPAPLPNNSTLTINPGAPSPTSNPCFGSCFALEVAPGFFVWTDILPGTDGGIIVGKPQLPGSQLEGPSLSATDPGELTAAYLWFGNYGTFTTAAVSGGVAGNITHDATLNVFSDTSCAGASCVGVTELGAFTLVWNGIATPFGNADGCLSAACTADQLAGINTDSYTIALDETGTGPYELMYSQVGPSGDPSGGFGDVRFSLILRGTATKAINTAPKINGFWPSNGGLNSFVFVFGENFQTNSGILPKVGFGPDLSQTYTNIVQIASDDLLLAMQPIDDAFGPITVETFADMPLTSLGVATSTSNYDIFYPEGNTVLNGVWPNKTGPYEFVFVFGDNFIAEYGATIIDVNGTEAQMVQVIAEDLAIFRVPPTATSGPVCVNIPRNVHFPKACSNVALEITP